MIDSSIETSSEAETAAAGERLAATLGTGGVVLLIGELGAGKTAFVRGLARGLGIDPGEVSSPTFTLIQEYRRPGRTLYHVDFYRLDHTEIDDLGLEELLAGDAVVAIEWADRWTRCPKDAVSVYIEDIGEERRRITVKRRESRAAP